MDIVDDECRCPDMAEARECAVVTYTVGLKTDGTVVGVGYNNYGELNVDSWTDIVQVSAGYNHTLGVKANGTVVGAGTNYTVELTWTRGQISSR